MPSTLRILFILAFWLASTGWVLWVKVIRWQIVDGPPIAAIDIADEVRSQPSNWTVWRLGTQGKPDQKLGEMTTQLKYTAADDSFLMTTRIPELNISAGDTIVKATKIDLQMGIDRQGRLLSESMTGTFTVTANLFGTLTSMSATSSFRAKVVAGELQGQCEIFTDKQQLITRQQLPSVPVTEGQVLNPLMPLNRIQGIYPGKSWVIQHSDPLFDSIALLAKQPSEKRDLRATVRAESSVYERKNEAPIPCWVIDYESRDNTIRIETWVDHESGRVWRQQVKKDEDVLRLDRRD